MPSVNISFRLAAYLPNWLPLGVLRRLPFKTFLSILQFFNLFLEKFPEKLTQLVQCDFARLIFVQNPEHYALSLILIVLLIFGVDVYQQRLNE